MIKGLGTWFASIRVRKPLIRFRVQDPRNRTATVADPATLRCAPTIGDGPVWVPACGRAPQDVVQRNVEAVG
jgi:hypothetical protein